MKKFLSLIFAFTLLVSVVGCTSNTFVKEGGKLESFSYWVPMPLEIVSQYQSLSEVTMYQEMEKLTGVKVEFKHPPAAQSGEQFNLMIASRELPDVMEYNWLGYPGGPDKAINDGIIIDATDIIKQYAPNYYKALQDNDMYKKQASTDEKKLYGFASLNTGNYRVFGGMLIRQDWLEELSLPVPVTISEWENVLRVFKEKKGAKFPLTLTNSAFSSSMANHFNNAFNVGINTYVDNGKIKYPIMETGFKDYLTLMNKWYTEGLLDQEYSTNNQTVVDAKMTNGTSGATYGYIGGTIGKYANAMKDKDPKFKIVSTQFPVMNKDDEPRFVSCQFEANQPVLAITTACKNPIEVAKWIDYLYSAEGTVLKNFGVEGKTYNKVNDKFVYTDEILKNPNGYSIAEAMARNFRANSPAPGFCQHEDYLAQYYQLQEQKDALLQWSKFTENAKSTILPPITPTTEESEELITLSNDINTYTGEMVFKFINGTEPFSNYATFVDKLKKMKVDRLIEIYQQSLDRYYKR